ncbi:AEC family transporter [Neotamlana laminarinivorans]|uniref:Permease n=1 Tax=Neotamlana laminarinivorans TaxID=2883124 RepID=A0A9X1HYP8_9FLAO|nr:permease [Tamlana laminarinivorans]MCB4797735.1 permease [Tamlana laminarinivorans]
MSDAITKAISFLAFIIIGIILKKKFASKEEVNGLKKIILLLALPCTIFVALLKVKLNANLFVLPLIALGFNLILFYVTPILLQILGITDRGIVNTIKLLIPSLAPGLSCFPFILEFLGEDYLAKAAMADLGNKFFVLFILYLVAIRWFYKNSETKQESVKTKLKSLAKTMFFEPVNIFIIVALILLSLNISLNELPLFLQNNLLRLSAIMTPLVLLFIGLALKLQRKQFAEIFSILMLRYGLTLFLIAAVVAIAKIKVNADILFAIAFGLSSCSFWPFAHISTIATKEIDLPKHKQTFNTDYALSILALSLPLSVILILGVLVSGNTFANTNNILFLALALTFFGIAMPLYKWGKRGAQIKSRYSNIK